LAPFNQRFLKVQIKKTNGEGEKGMEYSVFSFFAFAHISIFSPMKNPGASPWV
jgi:hypothetical protein